MTAVLVAAGAAVEVVAWRVVATGRGTVWTVMTVAMSLLGAGALVAGVVMASEVSVPVSAAAGVASGVGLFAATRAFVAIVRGRWRSFGRDASSLYGARRGLPLWAAILLGAVLLVSGEELFWRGFVQARLADADGRALGALASLGAFVGVNVASANLAVIAAAVVGGTVWTALAYWTGGALASLLSHSVWTALMLAFPAASAGAAPAIDAAA
ncbi:MAG: CPBP family intramembrane metalloprotease [Actinomycetota bacterium]|nr:CPBP family intramembrane metalloprotease [Actinomycetota bacterium]